VPIYNNYIIDQSSNQN